MPNSRPLLLTLGLAAAVSMAPDRADAQAEAGFGAIIGSRFSLDPASPEVLVPGQSAAHVFAGACNGALGCIPPVPYLTPPMLGLALGDNIDSFSTGAGVATTFPPPPGNRLRIHFSITPASAGANPIIMLEVAGDGAANDIFTFDIPGGLDQFANGLGPPPPQPWPFLGLQLASDVDGWAWIAPPGPPRAYFTLDAPTAAGYGVTPADILWNDVAAVFATRAALGLVDGDVIDALCVVYQTVNPAVWETGEMIYFSLTPGSPTLALNGWSPADILAVTFGGVPYVWAPAGALGLLFTDDINALQVFDPGDCGGSVPSLSGIGVALSALLLLGGAVLVMLRRA